MTGAGTRCVRLGWLPSARGSPAVLLAAAARRRKPRRSFGLPITSIIRRPDWLGPQIADALRIPYVVAEASDAPKQASRPWAAGREAAERAIRRADAVIGLNPADRECVLPLLRDAWRWVPFKPFIDAASYRRTSIAPGRGRRA